MLSALKILAVLVVGTAIGLFATWIIVFRGGMPSAIANGPWRTSLATGSEQGDPYTRASVAVHGLLALSRIETLYFTATQDSDGNSLDGRCTYVVSGRDPDARWWSVTAYGSDDYLIANPAHRYSVSATSVARNKDGSFAIAVGGERKDTNWIPTADGPFALTLRLYNPGAVTSLDPETAQLPTLKKVSCP
jgi:hypothetical protein